MTDKPEPRRFPPPWSVEEPDPKLARQCYIVRDANGHALAYLYFAEEPGCSAVLCQPNAGCAIIAAKPLGGAIISGSVP